jgi:hypothetical protein
LTARWPVHPQPLGEDLADRESVTSWMMRQAHANAMSYREFLRSAFGPGEWRRKDLDLLDEPLLTILAQWGSVRGSGGALLRGTATQWLGLISLEKADRKSWISSLWVTRFCSLCLAEDQTQYLRAIWRLYVSPLCLKHRILLRNACDRCGRTQPLTSFVKDDVTGICRHCEHRLEAARAILPQHHEALLHYVDALPEIFLMKGRLRERFGWPYSEHEFFEVLRFFIRILGLGFGQKAQMRQLRNYYGLPDDGENDWRKSEAVGCILINESLKLMQAWPKHFDDYLEQKRALFVEVGGEYGERLPAPLAPFRIPRQGNHRWDDFKPVHSTADRETRVREAVTRLVEKDRRIGPVTVQRATGIDFRTLRKHPELTSIIVEAKRMLLTKRLNALTNAVAELRFLGDNDPSTRTIAAYLGHSPKYLTRSPELSEQLGRLKEETKK